jgi:hypothetical protein
MTTVASDNFEELHRELSETYDTAADRYITAVRELDAAATEAKATAARMQQFLGYTRPELVSDLRAVAAGSQLRDLGRLARSVIPGSLWLNSAHDRWQCEKHLDRVAAARNQVEAEVAAGQRDLRTGTMGESGMSDAIREVLNAFGRRARRGRLADHQP